MTAVPRPAPLYLHDVAELLHAHLTKPSTSGNSYTQLRALFRQHAAHHLHVTGPRCIHLATHTQHLYQAAILLLLSPSLTPALCPQQHINSKRIALPDAAFALRARTGALALLVLLYESQPPAHAECVRVDSRVLCALQQLTAECAEAHVLYTHLLERRALRKVAQLRHSPALTPPDLTMSPMHPILSRWNPQSFYGYSIIRVDLKRALQSVPVICSCAHRPGAPTPESEEIVPDPGQMVALGEPDLVHETCDET